MKNERIYKCERWRPRVGTNSRGSAEAGQSLVELALVLPVLLLLLAGAVEFGRIGYAAMEVSNAARAGVAYGAQNVFTAVDLSGMQAAAINDGTDIAGWKTGGFTATASQYCRCSNGQPITCSSAGTSCTSPARILVYVQVSTQANIDAVLPMGGLPKSYIIHGKAIMRVQQ